MPPKLIPKTIFLFYFILAFSMHENVPSVLIETQEYTYLLIVLDQRLLKCDLSSMYDKQKST